MQVDFALPHAKHTHTVEGCKRQHLQPDSVIGEVCLARRALNNGCPCPSLADYVVLMISASSAYKGAD